MAELFLSSLVELLISSSKDLVLQQVVDSWGLKEKFEDLERMLQRIQSMLSNAEERHEDSDVKSWLAALKGVAYNAEDVLDEFNTEIKMRKATADGKKMMGKVLDFFSSRNQILFGMNMGRKLNGVVSKINKLAAEITQFSFENHRTQLQATIIEESHSYINESTVVGRKEDKEEILKHLLDSDNNEKVPVLSIIGMGGVGKTTLAKLIYNEQQVVDNFQLRIWVSVSDYDGFNVENIVQAIIDSTTGTNQVLPNKNKMELLQRRLREALTGKRYLLVLDDVWNKDPIKWDHLKGLLDCGGEGSAIILTTRDQQVSLAVGAVAHPLRCLTEDDSLILFKKRAFSPTQEQPENLVRIGESIIKKCAGLPLAVEVLGSLMRHKKDEEEWRSILNSDLCDINVSQEGILPVLQLSYNHLPSYGKRCFTYCAIFPKDHKIDEETLINLWMAHGLIPSQVINELEVKGHEIFTELVQRSFLQILKGAGGFEYGYNSITTCSMHDLVHDLAQFIMGNECVTELKKFENVKSKNILHLSLPDNSSIQKTSNRFSSLRTLLFRDLSFGDINDVWVVAKSTSLRAFEIHSWIPIRFPISMKYLKHLRYLDLSRTIMRSLPEATCMLVNLQTLKLSDCEKLWKLPSKMKCMVSLRHIYLDGCNALKQMPVDMGRLRNLQKLTNYVVGVDVGRGLGQLKHLNLSGELQLCNLEYVKDAASSREANLHAKQKLHSLAFCWGAIGWTINEYLTEETNLMDGQNAEEVLKELNPPMGIKVLILWGYKGVNYPTWMADSGLLKQLVMIQLGACRRCEHLPPFWQLPSLKALYLKHMDALRHVICVGQNHSNIQEFPSLKKLVLHELPSLEGWWERDEEDAAQKSSLHLVELEIIGCPKLRTFPRLLSLKELNLSRINTMLLQSINRLSTITELKIENFEKNVSGEEQSSLSQSIMSLRSFDSLQELGISTCEEPPTILLDSEDATSQLSSVLRKLIIRKCDWIFSSQQIKFWRSLASLHTLHMHGCESLVSLPEELQGLSSLKDLRLTHCSNLISFSSPPPPSSLSSTSAPSHRRGFPLQLEVLQLHSCDGVEELPSLPGSLKELTIWKCSNLRSITEDLGRLTSLEEIEIYECPSLATMLVGEGQLTKLQRLRLESCDSLAFLPEGMQNLTALRTLLINSCPKLSSLPQDLVEALSNLNLLVICVCPKLERKCERQGQYGHLVSNIPHTLIGARSIPLFIEYALENEGDEFLITHPCVLSSIKLVVVVMYKCFSELAELHGL